MKKVILTLGIGLAFASAGWAQGCSDAGFCTMGENLPSPSDSTSESHHQIGLLLTNGIGDEGVYIFTPAIQYDYNSQKHWAFQAKITGNYASGNLGTASDLGDAFVSGVYTINRNARAIQSITAGVKLPLSNGDLKSGYQSLPMQYQSSLGTTDLVVGYSTKYNKWLFAAALQQPISNTNKNTFLVDSIAYPNSVGYPPTNSFSRKGDVLLRAGYQIRNSAKVKWSASLLAIYHIGEDTYVDNRVSESPIAIVGSSGLTLNLTSAYYYQWKEKISLGIVGGFPLVVRDVRPDGLTRAFAISPEIVIHF